MLLKSSTSYCQTNNGSSSSTGKQIESVTVPMSYIRKADSMLIDYKYLKQTDVVKDSVIKTYEASNIKLSKQLVETTNKYTKVKKNYKIWRISSIGVVLAAIVAIILK